MQKYKWVILGVVILFLSLGLVYKEGFVEQSGKYIYSTTMYDNKNYKGHNLYDKMINIDSENCFKYCISDSDCTGYVIDKNSCQLKKGNINKDDLNNDKAKTIIINKIKKNLILKKNKNIKGEPLKEYNESSYTDCYDYCISHSRCSAFVTDFDYEDGPGKCKLYSDISNNMFKDNDKYTSLLN